MLSWVFVVLKNNTEWVEHSLLEVHQYYYYYYYFLQEIFIVHCIGWKTLLSCQYIKIKYFQLYDSNNYVRPVMLWCDHLFLDFWEHTTEQAILSKTVIMRPSILGVIFFSFLNYFIEAFKDLFLHPAVLGNIVQLYRNTGGTY